MLSLNLINNQSNNHLDFTIQRLLSRRLNQIRMKVGMRVSSIVRKSKDLQRGHVKN
jgi:hypothetical protein